MNIFVINLPSSIERRNFQQEQLSKLGLNFEFLDAISVQDINAETYRHHAKDWQRPLKNTEMACYYSHRYAWNRVMQGNQATLILEDDALLSNATPEILKRLLNKENVDLINLENRGRKKFISKISEDITDNTKLLRLYQDRTGAAGYVLWPSGAKKLIQCEAKKGVALADAHITACNNLLAYQVEPTPIIQLDYCEYYGIKNTTYKAASKSILGAEDKLKGNWFFRLKRIHFQVKLGFRQLILITFSQRRYIKINQKDFL